MTVTVIQASQYLELCEKPLDKSDETVLWVRLKKDQGITGFVTYLWKWRQWTWKPEEGYQHSESCLFDIVGFLRMLNKERPEGRKP